MSKLNFLIFTRTCNRKKFFEECHNSIINLNLCDDISVKHIVSYDDDITHKNYLNDEKYNNVIKVKVDKIKRETFQHFPYNLYFNNMYEYIRDNHIELGIENLHNTWVLYLDDDDIYVNRQILIDLYRALEEFEFNKRFLLLWKVQFPNKIVPMHCFGNKPESGEMSTIGVCHHISRFELVEWDNMKQGDYRFIKRVFELEDTETIWIDKVYTAINYDHGIGGLGMTSDKDEKIFNQREAIKLIEHSTKKRSNVSKKKSY